LDHHSRLLPNFEALVSSFTFSRLEQFMGFGDGFHVVQPRKKFNGRDVSAAHEKTAHDLARCGRRSFRA
jgi:hypothetical protein